MKIGDLVNYKKTPPYTGIHKGIGIIIKNAETSSIDLEVTYLVYWPNEHPLHQRRWERADNIEVMK